VAWFSWSRHRGGAGWLTVVAAPELVATLVQAATAELPDAITGVTVPADAQDLLPSALRPVDPTRWDWFWTATPPSSQRGENHVRWARADDEQDIEALLDQHSPRHSARPGNADARRWCVVDASGGPTTAGAEAGGLLACAAHVEYVPEVPHLASIVTRRDLRGQGLGAAVTAWLTRQLLAEGAPIVTLGMYDDNQTARRMYRRLGYVDSHHWLSGSLPGRATVPMTHE